MKTLILAAAIAALLFTGCSASDSSEVVEEVSVSINEICPMMEGPVKDDGGRTEFMGETVGFCCPGCADDFNALDEAGKTAALESVGVTIDS